MLVVSAWTLATKQFARDDCLRGRLLAWEMFARDMSAAHLSDNLVQRVESDVSNIVVSIDEEPTENVDSEHPQAALNLREEA